MKKTITLVFTLITVLMVTRVNLAMRSNQSPLNGNSGSALVLTPLIDSGKTNKARTLSRVHAEVLNMKLESYSGYLTVRPLDDANLFFWFFPALKNAKKSPVVLWMNGGPGLTSLSGLFAEIGPYFVTNDSRVERRPVTWVSKFNVIFLDAPVGTGLSFATSESAYSTTTDGIATDIHEALRQFFLIFKEYAPLPLYATGESYGGKYAVGLANLVTTMNLPSPINLKGIILISALYDPINVIQSADYLYQVGLVRKPTYEFVAQTLAQFAALVNADKYVAASQVLVALTGSGGTTYQPSFFKNEAGITGSNNVLRDVPLTKYQTYIPFVDKNHSLRVALHINATVPFNEMPPEVMATLVASGDFAKSTRPELQTVLDAGAIRVMFVTGNMDYLIVPVGATKAAEALEWKCQDEFINATRIIWRVNENDVNSAGYVMCACNFCNVLVRNAGHRLPGDEPTSALDLIDRFINNKPY